MQKTIIKILVATLTIITISFSSCFSASATYIDLNVTLSQTTSYRYAAGTATNKSDYARKLSVSTSLYHRSATSSYTCLITASNSTNNLAINCSVYSGEAKYARSFVDCARVSSTMYNDGSGFAGVYASASSGYMYY